MADHDDCRTRCSRDCPAPQWEGGCRWPLACDGPGCPGCPPPETQRWDDRFDDPEWE